MSACQFLFLIMHRLDDIQDGSERRRGLPAAHLIYGWSQTINSTTHALFKATESLEGLTNENCRIIYLDLYMGERCIYCGGR